MALDRQKKLQQAERLFKQGKAQEALVELESLAHAAPDDLLTLNRMGDLLAKQGRPVEAIDFYRKIARQFTSAGFLPKAVAIHKKILRLDASCVEALLALGELYRQQKLPGEARSYLLKAADVFVQDKDFTRARQVYEQLVEAEPSDPRHRARLAEARAAEGETAKAGEDLLGLADSLYHSGKVDDAEHSYRRAAEMMDGRPEPTIGIARCHVERGRLADAAAALEAVPGELAGSPAILGERVLVYDADNRLRDAMELMKHPAAVQIEDPLFARMFERHVEAGDASRLWEAMRPVFERWEGAHRERLLSLLDRLGEVESGGHLPALQLRYEVLQRGQDVHGLADALRRLIEAYRGQGMEAESEPLVARLSQLQKAGGKTVVEASDAEAPPFAAAAGGGDARALEAEAPAVPLNRSDEEFVDGRMTQAEILEKYGLRDQALAQVREVIQKFPGHLVAQERWVKLLREESTPRELRDGLFGLALAQRASGDVHAARQTAAEAVRVHALDPSQVEIFRRFELTAPPAPVPEPAPDSTRDEATRPAPRAAAPTAEPERVGGDDVIVIDLDDMDDEEAVDEPVESVDDGAIPLSLDEPVDEAPAPAAPPASTVRSPGSDLLQEIELCLERGDLGDARRRVEALRTLGYGGDALQALQARLDRLEAETAPPSAPEDLTDVGLLDELGDDDLSTITAALESELFAEDHVALGSPDPESEQSLEEVFAAFKEQVEQEVEQDDFRTHYDLGIAYKEMGLTDEAIGEFRRALGAPELCRQSFTMLAICHRERDELDEAVRCYRSAIEQDDSHGAVSSGLRYELAELLLEHGDRDAALGEFRVVHDVDPTFRDVGNRIAELEACTS